MTECAEYILDFVSMRDDRENFGFMKDDLYYLFYAKEPKQKINHFFGCFTKKIFFPKIGYIIGKKRACKKALMEKENEEIKKTGQNDEDSDELVMLYQEQ